MGQQILYTSTLGGYLTAPKLSKKLYEAALPMMRFRQFCSFKEAWGKGRGESVLFDRFSNISTAGGTLVETSTIPRHNIVFSQGTLTVTEYGNAMGKTAKLESLADFDINNPMHRALRNDMAKTIDNAVGAQFQDTLAKYVCITSSTSTLSTNGTASASATSNLNAWHIKNVTDQLKKWNVEPFPDGNYVCIASVGAIRGILDDSSTGGWIDANRYAGSKRLFTGEVGEMHGVRFLQENNVLSNAIGNSTAYGEAVIFGQETVQEAVSIPEEIRVDTPRDFGRDMGVAWYMIGGWRIIWCGYLGDGTGSFSTANGWVPHIIHITST
jgi:N4-gp56 family major capsid protein